MEQVVISPSTDILLLQYYRHLKQIRILQTTWYLLLKCVHMHLNVLDHVMISKNFSSMKTSILNLQRLDNLQTWACSSQRHSHRRNPVGGKDSWRAGVGRSSLVCRQIGVNGKNSGMWRIQLREIMQKKQLWGASKDKHNTKILIEILRKPRLHIFKGLPFSQNRDIHSIITYKGILCKEPQWVLTFSSHWFVHTSVSW